MKNTFKNKKKHYIIGKNESTFFENLTKKKSKF